MSEYSDSKRKGNIGEAFVQCILSSFCLVHKIDGSQDLGNDFLCEITKGKYPTNILFYVQVKYWNNEPKDADVKRQFEYWEGASIPVYLFWIDVKEKVPFEFLSKLDLKDTIEQLKYKRYTPLTHGNTEKQIKEFKSFSKYTFLRDIMVDYARCQYKRGMSTVLKKNDFIEIDKIDLPLAENSLFVDDVIPNEYSLEFIKNSWTNLIATAKSLYVTHNNSKHHLDLALSHAYLAQNMIDFADSECKVFKSAIDGIIADIKTCLDKIDS